MWKIRPSIIPQLRTQIFTPPPPKKIKKLTLKKKRTKKILGEGWNKKY